MRFIKLDYSYHINDFSKQNKPGEKRQTISFVFDVVPTNRIRTREETFDTTQVSIKISINDSLRSKWAFSESFVAEDNNLLKILYEYARRFLEDKIQSGKTTGFYQLDLIPENIDQYGSIDPKNIELNYSKWIKVNSL